VEKPYHIVRKEESRELAKFLAKNGQAMLPRVELIEQSKLAVATAAHLQRRARHLRPHRLPLRRTSCEGNDKGCINHRTNSNFRPLGPLF
jgi:hypothetical protein